MKRAEAEIIRTAALQPDILGYNVHNIVCRTYFFNQIIRIPHPLPQKTSHERGTKISSNFRMQN